MFQEAENRTGRTLIIFTSYYAANHVLGAFLKATTNNSPKQDVVMHS